MAESTQSLTVEILNKNDCLTIIKNCLNLLGDNDFELLSYQVVKPSGDLVGFMGEYYKLHVDIREKNSNALRTLKFFVKSIPVTNEVYRDECERKGFFRKESRIYADILPNLQRYASSDLFPKSYLVRSDILVLEDFSLPEKGFQQLSPADIYTTKHLQLCVQLLARFHAASLAWETKESINIGEKFQDVLIEMQLTAKNEWYITGIKAALYLAQIHPKYQYPEAQEFINGKLYQLFLDMEQFANASTTLRNVLCHRDSWNSNIFWKFNPDTNEPLECRIVDFQLTRYSPPAIDVLNFLYNNFETSERRDKEVPELLKYYYSTLKEELKQLDLPEDLIPQQEFDEDCRKALLPVLTLRAICVPLFNLPKGWASHMRATEPKKFDEYMNSERTEMFERVSKLDPTYVEKILFPVQTVELLQSLVITRQVNFTCMLW
ncbi:uncharacterized protein LOC133334684 [Musca vetustissima]|uniref:uncharacterized protein LOC133334684 n=1 Tax=Musca vetustissima TaxID=27455 RepID=UPI002AB5ED4A|nr:uncharacterized protein LOC133334684 [Musca vetustissima]